MISDQANFLQSLGWAALNSLWQMALLWIGYQIINATVKLKPSHKASFASILLIAGFGWFISTFLVSSNYSFEQSTFSNGIILVENNTQLNSFLNNALPIGAIIYLSLLLFPILKFIRNYRYVQIIRKYGLSKIDIDSRIYINKTSLYLGIKRKVKIWVSDLVSSPVTIGFLKPIILVPMAAINQLSTDQLEAVLLHELAHIKRNDYFINLIINFIQTLLYFNPFVTAFRKIIEFERERSCDDLVLQFQYKSEEYASALLTLEKVNQTQKFLVLPASGNKNDLRNRIEKILQIKSEKRKIHPYKITGIICAICFLFFIHFISISDSNNFGESSRSNIFTNTGVSYSGLTTPNDSFAESRYSIVNHPQDDNKTIINDSKPRIEAAINNAIPADYMNVAFSYEIAPELNKNEEDQIKAALVASKKVLENNQWKTVETNIADVFTEQEKSELKASYLKELNKFDWNKWENKLRTVYDNINWDKVNAQLNNAIHQIKLDSLQNVYYNVALKLNEAQKEMQLNKVMSIPDSDITLENITEKKEIVQRILNELSVLRTKKIVHL